MPLHPALVHLPLALAMLLPLLGLLAFVAMWRSPADRRGWGAFTLSAALMAGSAFVALQTGEQEEDRVEVVVSHAALHAHEELAEQFLALSVALAIIAAIALAAHSKPVAGRPLAALAVLVSAAALVQGLRTGHAGGELVYTHNAASAYSAGGAASGGEARGWDRAREDDHDRD